MPTIGTEVEFDIICNTCKTKLEVSVESNSKGNTVWAEPCGNCMDDARSEGYVDGMNDETTRISRMP